MVTDEMVEKAERVYWDSTNDPEGARDMRAALEAALSAAEPVDYQLVFSDGRTSRVLYSKDEAERFKKASDITVDIRALYSAPSVAVKALQDHVLADFTHLTDAQALSGPYIVKRIKERFGSFALSAQVHDVAGWQLVPIEPTDEMQKAGDSAMTETGFCARVYSAMLAAAPAKQEG